jgi:hypothetical protein
LASDWWGNVGEDRTTAGMNGPLASGFESRFIINIQILPVTFNAA